MCIGSRTLHRASVTVKSMGRCTVFIIMQYGDDMSTASAPCQRVSTSYMRMSGLVHSCETTRSHADQSKDSPRHVVFVCTYSWCMMMHVA